MNGKTAAALLLMGLLCACAPVPPPPAPAPPPPAAPAPAPAPVAEAPADHYVAIRAVTCDRLLELSPEDRAAASMFYVGYQASRSGVRSINVALIKSMVTRAIDYCQAYPDRTAVQAFAYGYLR
jgi:hypothetical protein